MSKDMADVFRCAVSGDEQAFGIIFRQWYPRACRVAYRILGDMMLSRDVAQDTFVEWWKRRENFQTIEASRSFVYVSVKNKSLTWLRDHGKEVYPDEGLPDVFDSDFDAWVVEEEAVAALWDAIERLPEQSAHVMRMVAAGKRNKEIAELLGISVNTVKTLKYNAIRILKGELSGRVYFLFMLMRRWC